MVHHITSADNSSKHEPTGPAFFSANAGAVPDSLIVDADAYLIADDGTGVHLIGLWNVTINGTIGTFDGFSDAGLIVDPDLAPGLGHVTIGSAGDVFGATGIKFNVGGSITNKGIVSGGFHSAIGGSSDDNLSVNNSGIIQGGGGGAIGHSGAGDPSVKNSGTIFVVGSSTITQVGAGDLTVINSGLIECASTFGIETVNGVLNLVNTGTIVGVDSGQL